MRPTWRALAVFAFAVGILCATIDLSQDHGRLPGKSNWPASHAILLQSIAAGVLSLRERSR